MLAADHMCRGEGSLDSTGQHLKGWMHFAGIQPDLAAVRPAHMKLCNLGKESTSQLVLMELSGIRVRTLMQVSKKSESRECFLNELICLFCRWKLLSALGID